jgi:hypothetical protein
MLWSWLALISTQSNVKQREVERLTLDITGGTSRVCLQARGNQGTQLREVLALARKIGQAAHAILRDPGGCTLLRASVDLSFKPRNGGIRVCPNQCKGEQKQRWEVRKEMHLYDASDLRYELEL